MFIAFIVEFVIVFLCLRIVNAGVYYVVLVYMYMHNRNIES